VRQLPEQLAGDANPQRSIEQGLWRSGRTRRTSRAEVRLRLRG
jgi:hypothetical protein